MAAESAAGPQEMMEGESPAGLPRSVRGSGWWGRLLERFLRAVRRPAARRGGWWALRGSGSPRVSSGGPLSVGPALPGAGVCDRTAGYRGSVCHREQQWGCGDGLT